MPGPLSRRSFLAAAGGGLAAAVLAACGGDGASDDDGTLSLSGGTVPADGPNIVLHPPRQGDRLVAMVGDSITVGSTPALREVAEELEIDLVIDAEVGRRITVGGPQKPGIDAVGDVVAEVGEPDLWVIALGTNDVGQYDTDEYEVLIGELIDLIPDDAPVAWINVYLEDRPDDSAEFNRALTNALSARGQTTVGAWTSYATNDGILADGVHPTTEGAARFVDVVADQIAGWLS